MFKVLYLLLEYSGQGGGLGLKNLAFQVAGACFTNLPMATQVQYSFFKAIYDEENSRYNQLESRTKFYLTIQTFYLGALAFKWQDVQSFTQAFAVALVVPIGIACLLLTGLLLTVLAVRIRVYESPTDLNRLIQSFGNNPPSDAEFLDNRLVDFAVATDRNSIQNDKVAELLNIVVWLLFSAVTLHLGMFLFAYFGNNEKT